MQKDKRNIFIFIVVLAVLVFVSYWMFESGATEKIRGMISKLTASVNQNASSADYPVIDLVVNSSGEKTVNNDVAITINASSKYKIDSIKYSFDKKNWYSNLSEVSFGTNASGKIIFNKTMNKSVYIQVQNEKGYKSYVYETKVNIDKILPIIEVNKDKGNYIIEASDNNFVSKIQYSNDAINWDNELVSENKDILLTKENFNYTYARAVDSVGNISKYIQVK